MTNTENVSFTKYALRGGPLTWRWSNHKSLRFVEAFVEEINLVAYSARTVVSHRYHSHGSVSRYCSLLCIWSCCGKHSVQEQVSNGKQKQSYFSLLVGNQSTSTPYFTMALRIRSNGDIYCAAKTQPEPDDTYLPDQLHYELSVIQKVLIADKNEETNGRWYWLHGECNRSDHVENARHGTFVRTE